jgi:hypothetical protein
MAAGILVFMKPPGTALCILDGLQRASDIFLIASESFLRNRRIVVPGYREDPMSSYCDTAYSFLANFGHSEQVTNEEPMGTCSSFFCR